MQATKFHSYPVSQTDDGAKRLAGFEFELAGISIADCADIIKHVFGGSIEAEHSLVAKLKDTELGDFTVELDAVIVKEVAAKLEEETDGEERVDLSDIKQKVSQWMGELAGQFVPCEIVTPPIAFDDFEKLEQLREALQAKKAEGTKARFTHAFGMHLNPDVASTDAAYLTRIMLAFLLLYPWLKQVMQVDFSRRVLTYIDPFPKSYVKLLMKADYAPELAEFIEDYLEHNPTRNRALDMLPLFAAIMPEALDELDEEKKRLVKPRKTFHYRLPNCEIDDPDWRIARDWNYWIEVEQLAEEEDKLKAMCADYLTYLTRGMNLTAHGWIDKLVEDYGYDSPA